ncbi:hypothetical protein LO763_23635 [Glycomyces sp. A-F 0318]|uniref:YqeB family protein n=1 Tax=Glycomyces amatae TaxID=2881355 RepID=UPI001E3574B8|nr:hypothetical protein [Glycomyces amatae]MCD0446614.1 hypothetical protein [Glycomyces amatae]
MSTDRTAGGARTTVADPAWARPALLAGLPLVGAALGWGLSLVAEWITGLSWFPFQGLFELFTDLPETVRLIVALALGLVVGVLLALWAIHEMLTVTVGSARLELERGDYRRGVDRADTASVFVQDKQLVVLGHRRQELARVPFDLDRDELAAALRRHGYAWLPDGDPYADEFRRWVPGAEGLPKGADAVLKARGQALEKSKEDDLRELRDELAVLGVVVYDKDKKQYWRRSDPA